MPGQANETPAKLAGWKEIAAFVGREVRTVQRWERELGLPVHRPPGSHGHSVFAYPDEINRWFEAGGIRATPAEKDSGSAPPKDGDSCISASLEGTPSVLPQVLADAQGRNRLWRVGTGTLFGALAILLIAVFLMALSGYRHTTLLGSGQPAISSVTPILPQADQTIVISGRGLGSYTPFNNLDTPFLPIRDNSAHWAAGRIIPENQDEVTLNVARWSDSEIVATGLAGAYGRNNWVLNPSDNIEIAVWNPQTGAGPALYRLQVGPGTSRR